MDDQTAIVTDVEEAEKKPILPRDAVIAEMNERRMKELEEESEKDGREEQSLPADEEELPLEDDVKQEPEMVELKVDGKIIVKPKTEVDASGGTVAMQKALALETRLSHAAAERKRLDAEKEEFDRRLRELNRREQELSQKDKNAQDVDHSAIQKKFIESVYSGDEEEALKSFNEIVSGLKAKPVVNSIDPELIANQIEQKIAYKTSLNEGVNLLNTEYQHIVSDPNLYEMTDRATARIRREHPDWKPKDIIKTAAKEVDEWISKFQPGQSDDLISQRNERKKTIDNIPTAQTKKAGAVEQKTKSPREIFEEIKKGRSQ